MSVHLEPDKQEIDKHFAVVFQHASLEASVNIRLCPRKGSGLATHSHMVRLKNAPAKALQCARWAARHPGWVLALPVTTYQTNDNARRENIDRVHALVAEIDDSPVVGALDYLERILDPSSLVLHSGGVTPEGEAKAHSYWVLDPPADTPEAIADAQTANRLIAGLIDSDTSAQDGTHPFRVAGSWNTKDPDNPRMATIQAISGREYALPELLHRFKPRPMLSG